MCLSLFIIVYLVPSLAVSDLEGDDAIPEILEHVAKAEQDMRARAEKVTKPGEHLEFPDLFLAYYMHGVDLKIFSWGQGLAGWKPRLCWNVLEGLCFKIWKFNDILMILPDIS